MLLDVLFGFADHDLQSVEVVSLRVSVKVKLLILDCLLVLRCVVVSNVLVAQHLLSRCFHLKKVDAKYPTVGLGKVLEV